MRMSFCDSASVSLKTGMPVHIETMSAISSSPIDGRSVDSPASHWSASSRLRWVSRLVGAPPGYVGYEEGGQLTEAVRRRPYSVVLLDEVEKAHPDVFNALLQVMDDGRLTDGQGRTVSFKNVVLIMTSNISGGRIGAEGHFRPEFINRLDDIVEFEPLSREQLGEIVELQVALVSGRLAQRGIAIELTDDARTLLGNLGYDPTYGARPLKRVIQKRLVDPLALALLEGRFVAGDTVKVGASEGELAFERVPVEDPAVAV